MAATVQPKERINVTFPKSILESLAALVPPRERNAFIVEATGEALRRRRLLKALRESSGAWSDEDHPALMTAEDIDRYVRQLRETWMPRTWEEMAEEGKSDG
ncbi:MAG: hypothetical protein ACUVR4_14745 [Anaerolineae bacterium]